jgi:hypothetical protein
MQPDGTYELFKGKCRMLLDKMDERRNLSRRSLWLGQRHPISNISKFSKTKPLLVFKNPFMEFD